MSSAQTTRLIPIFLWVLIAAANAEAQVTIHYWSLEARIADAQSVYRGHIVKLSRKVIVPKNKPLPDGTPYSDGVVVYRFTVQVTEVLKGKRVKQIVLGANTSAYNLQIDEWMKARTEFLWFVGSPHVHNAKDVFAPSPGPSWKTLRLGKAVPAESGYTSPQALPYFSMDLSVLRTPKAALARARAFAKAHPKVTKLHEITIPHAIASLGKGAGVATFLTVPVVPPLEGVARRMITAPREFIPKKYKLDSLSRYVLRKSGVIALKHFKSNRNIALLKTLLNDGTDVYTTYDFGKLKGKRFKKFPIRAEAHKVLTGWGVEVPKPVTEVEVPPED